MLFVYLLSALLGTLLLSGLTEAVVHDNDTMRHVRPVYLAAYAMASIFILIGHVVS